MFVFSVPCKYLGKIFIVFTLLVGHYALCNVVLDAKLGRNDVHSHSVLFCYIILYYIILYYIILYYIIFLLYCPTVFYSVTPRNCSSIWKMQVAVKHNTRTYIFFSSACMISFETVNICK